MVKDWGGCHEVSRSLAMGSWDGSFPSFTRSVAGGSPVRVGLNRFLFDGQALSHEHSSRSQVS